MCPSATRCGAFVLGALQWDYRQGFYLPSGISTLTATVRSKDWGKAIAIHELAPNVRFPTASLLSEALLLWFNWRNILALLLGIAPGSWVVLIVFLQPLVAVCFFPPGFAALSGIGPPSVRNISVSLTVPVGFLVGGGAIPTGIGMLGDRGRFDLGISLVGVIIMGGFLLLHYLRFQENEAG
jgi:hypothetical protein